MLIKTAFLEFEEAKNKKYVLVDDLIKEFPDAKLALFKIGEHIVNYGGKK